MEPDAAPTDELARRLAAVHLDLAYARDELDTVAAVARAALPYGVALLDLHYLEVDADGTPLRTRPVALWTREDGAAPHPLLGATIDLTEIPLSMHWTRDRERPLIVADAAADPRCDDELRRILAGRRAMAVLPLYSTHPAGWQGLLTLHWHAPHEPDADELLVYRVLMAGVAAFVADHRALRAHEAALAEIRALYRVSARVNESADPAELLTALSDPAFDRGCVRASLLTMETGPSGQVESFELIAVRGSVSPFTIGTRFPRGNVPFSDVLLTSTDALLCIEDIDTDPRVDPQLRAVYAAGGMRAVLMLPMRWAGRWIGVVSLGWATPQTFDAGLRRLFASVAHQTAAVLDNRLLVERTRRAIDDNREQHRTMMSLLDHLPLGVTVFDAAGRRLMTNRAGVELLGLGATLEDQNQPQTTRTYHPGTDRRVAQNERVSQRAIETREIVTGDVDFDRRDGTRVTVTTMGVPIFDERGAVDRCILLFHDTGPRRAAERERTAIHDAIIAAQRAALAERSTPLIPLRDDLLVMPIVGAVDRERGRQIVDALLDLGGRTAVRAAILDLTGVRSVDADGARALLEAAHALRLRGVAPMFTGVGGEVAWTLVDLGVDLRGLATCATLRDGIARASRAAPR